jgi:ATP-dependent DNA helicase DinG
LTSVLADTVAEVLRPGGPLADALPGFEPRPGQLAMAARVAEALDADERLLVEAGTGTGKTLAYLVPAILSGRKVVISTGTKTLQDQIARIDLPRLVAALPIEFRFTVMKGLGNYLCLRRFNEHSAQAALALGEPDPTGQTLERVRAWIDETATGDRADLDDVPDDAPLWREITATPETRLGARCPYFERCFVTGMRRRALDAQLVLTNHHLFFADLALRARWPEAQVLPPYEVVIFDEAHQIEEVATEFFGLHVSSQRLYALARDIGRAPLAGQELVRAGSQARRLQMATESFAEALRDRLPAPRGGAEEIRVPVPEDLWAARAPPLARYHELDTILEESAALFDRLTRDDGARTRDEAPSRSPPSAAQAAVHGGIARRASALRAELGAMIDARGGGHGGKPLVRWLVASARQVSLRASPIDVGPLLRERWSAHPGPLVFTSATLSAAGGFEYVRGRLGLGDVAADATFPSPFCYRRQALVYIATDLPDPSDDRFPAAAAARALELCRVSRGRALLLFTSFRNLRVAEQILRADGGFPVLVQGERPRHALLADLRARIGSVLLATQSFWEGVDVPGEALSLVVVDRLPFAVPDDPLTAARIDRIREEGGDPFGSYQLPRAALSLKQGFGRLIRTRRDTGVAALLDGRILRRRYGAPLLASLPPDCPRTESLEDVAAFFESHRS